MRERKSKPFEDNQIEALVTKKGTEIGLIVTRVTSVRNEYSMKNNRM